LMPGGKNYAHFVPQTLRQLQWCGDSYIYRSGDTLHVAKVGGKEKLVTLSAIANAFKKFEHRSTEKFAHLLGAR
jgi:hypothetical protein